MKIFYMFLILASIFLLSTYKNYEKYNNLSNNIYDNIINNIYFMSKKETQIFFINDSDNYVNLLTPIDLKALQVKTKSDYMKRLVENSSDFTSNEKERLVKASYKADKFLINLNEFDTKLSPEFDNIKCLNIQWKFSKTLGSSNTQGLPHTREDIIFLNDNTINNSSENELIYILIHEKIHIYQRMYKQDMQKLFKRLGYNKYSYLKDYPMARSNPDVDRIVYTDPNGRLTYTRYSSDNPRNLFDVIYPSSGEDEDGSEHPNEYVSYYIDGLQRKICKKDSNNIYCNF